MNLGDELRRARALRDIWTERRAKARDAHDSYLKARRDVESDETLTDSVKRARIGEAQRTADAALADLLNDADVLKSEHDYLRGAVDLRALYKRRFVPKDDDARHIGEVHNLLADQSARAAVADATLEELADMQARFLRAGDNPPDELLAHQGYVARRIRRSDFGSTPEHDALRRGLIDVEEKIAGAPKVRQVAADLDVAAKLHRTVDAYRASMHMPAGSEPTPVAMDRAVRNGLMPDVIQ